MQSHIFSCQACLFLGICDGSEPSRQTLIGGCYLFFSPLGPHCYFWLLVTNSAAVVQPTAFGDSDDLITSPLPFKQVHINDEIT